MTPAQDVARFIEIAGHGVVASTIFVGLEPEAPANCVTVYDTGGGEVETDEVDVFNPSFQVRVRHKSYQAGYTLAAAIRDSLLGLLQAANAGRTYYGVAVTADVACLMKDEKDRHVFVASYRTTYQE